MILVGLSATVLAATLGTHGITPAQISALGDHDSPLLNDVDPGDTSTEFLWALLSPLVASGTTQVTDQGGYALVGAADGIWTQDYRFLAMPATGAPVVDEEVITTAVGSTGGSLSFLLEPAPLTVEVGDVATFTATATGGSGSYTYRWLRNGDEIPGETAATYDLVALLTDGGAFFSVEANDGTNTVTSTSALLTVNLVGGTLIVEDGTAKPDADSYIATADANIYHANRGNTAWAGLSTLAKEAALRKATDYMLQVYRWKWAGERKTTAQSLDWPRLNVPLQDFAGAGFVSDTTVPVPVQNACAELALRAAVGDLAPDVGRVATRERIDVIEVEYSVNAAPWVRYRAADNMLTAYFKPSAGSSIVVSRA